MSIITVAIKKGFEGLVAKLKGGVALVTGASSGIGDATAQRLTVAGYKVYGTSRRAAQAGKRSFEILPLDVTSDESEEAVVSEVMRREGRIDVLVNNAGFGLPLPERKRVRSIRPDRFSKRTSSGWCG
jgi:NAD(P)-dependent dehydrogenase (short-subunit alcohol dehydrogenase family)